MLISMNSMTGFGRGSSSLNSWLISVEINSVNRKQAEVVIQAPRELSEFEPLIRKAILASVSRGRVQVTLTIHHELADSSAFSLNLDLATSFFNAFSQLSAAVNQSVVPSASDVLRQPGLITTNQANFIPNEIWPAIDTALTEAISSFNTMRANEGLDLLKDFRARLQTLQSFIDSIQAIAPTRPNHYRETLLKRLNEANLPLDPSDDRILKEIAIFADRCDISEELTRLASHFDKFNSYLSSSEPSGRALDFLCQELFRELNTIGSKANDAQISHLIVEAKTELEKIREQIQNIE